MRRLHGLHRRRRQHARHHIGLHRQGPDAIPPPDDRIFLVVLEAGDLPQRNHPPVGQRDLQRAERFERGPLRLFGTRDHVDQVDAVAHLRHRGAGHHAVQRECHVLRTEAKLPRLVLVDADAHDARRFDPVEVDVAHARRRAQQIGDLQGDRAHALRVRPAHAVLHRPTHGRSKFQRIDARDHLREARRQGLFKSRAHLLALLEPLGHHDRLGEEVVGQGDVDRQIEADGALADIGGETLDIRVGGEQLVERLGNVACRQDRGIVLQFQIHQKLGAVGSGKELLRHQTGAGESGARTEQP